ncbi:MAG: hypothetical protein B7Z55_06145 [Planctomycetales bacterium 12-60-4]|nr:MAG: hypothetical protein B7Z55_06145 [Planctomycetales bacterium 12-60-4]
MSLRTLVPWRRGLVRNTEPDPFTALQSEINRAFEGFFDGGDLMGMKTAMTGMTPKLDLSETNEEFHLSVELPGMTEKDIEVELLDEGVKIHGEKKDERETKEHDFHRTERTFGMFERIVPLPKPINREGVKATFKNGVLSVELPKAVPAVTHQKVAVKAG